MMYGNNRILTRRELYDLVWSRPVQKLAAELGISDRGLAKICSRHRVPSPPRGYWARVAAGQKFKLPVFHETDDPALERIRIAATTAHLPEETREMLREVKAVRAKLREDGVVKPPIPSLPIEKPHPPIAPTARTLRKAKADEYGGVGGFGAGLCGVQVHKERINRVIALLNALAIRLEENSLRLQPDGTRMKIVVGPDEVTFTLTEKTRREKHIPTEEEQGLYERQQAKRQRAAGSRNWGLYTSLPYQKPWAEYDVVYTGQLAFVIDVWARGLRKTWADGKTQSIESMLNDIVLGLKVVLANKKTQREQREEDGRQQAELSRRRDLAKKRKVREEERIAYLRELIQIQREAGDVRAWLVTLQETATVDITSDMRRIMQWATARLAALESRTTIEAVTAELAEKVLFPEIDELDDPLGDPPALRSYW